jgi:hypothetical protein
MQKWDLLVINSGTGEIFLQSTSAQELKELAEIAIQEAQTYFSFDEAAGGKLDLKLSVSKKGHELSLRFEPSSGFPESEKSIYSTDLKYFVLNLAISRNWLPYPGDSGGERFIRYNKLEGLGRMTERKFRYLVTALLIFPFIALVDVIARPISLGNYGLRESFYLLFSIPIGLLAYCAWFQPEVIREMFGPFRPQGPTEAGFQGVVFPRINRRTLIFISLGLGVLLICGCQFALGLTVAQKFGLLPASPTPTSDFEATRMVAAATNQAAGSLLTETPTPIESNSTAESILTETPISPEGSPTIESVLTETPQALPASGMSAIGEQSQVNGIGVTVWDAYTTESIIISTAASGKLYLVIEVVIQNLGRDTEMPYAPTDFILRDANGVEYQANSTSMEPPLGGGNLATGEEAQGYVTFEVPATAIGFVVTYNPGDLLDGNVPLQFDLNQ